MTIEYRPPALRDIATSRYAEKRLKNRTGNSWCETCSEQLIVEGMILIAIAEAVRHDSESPACKVVVDEDSCRMGLIQQG
jgi:hypothetical protein